MRVFKSFSVAVLFYSVQSMGVVSTGDIQLIQIASNTFQQLKDLKEILTKTREFSDEFEKVHRDVRQALHKADRAAMVMEDLKRLKKIDVNNLDSFNFALANLMASKQSLQRLLKENLQKKEETKGSKKGAEKTIESGRNRIIKLENERRQKTNVKQATIDSANSLIDVATENVRLSMEVAKLRMEMGRLTEIARKREEARLKKELLEKEKGDRIPVGVLTKEIMGERR